jgi:hypothetical protein
VAVTPEAAKRSVALALSQELSKQPWRRIDPANCSDECCRSEHPLKPGNTAESEAFINSFHIPSLGGPLPFNQFKQLQRRKNNEA